MKRIKRTTHAVLTDTQPELSHVVEAMELKNEDNVFRQFFEANFEALADVSPRAHLQQCESTSSGSGNETDSTSSDWGGLSNDESPTAVQVVEHTDFLGTKDETLNTSNLHNIEPNSASPNKSENKLETLNLKNDLELQRLLKESHLLDHSAGQSYQGSKRHQATDMRLQALGSKASILTQNKMPLAHRRGMHAKAKAREVTRRKEAKENGIILEREKAVKIRKQGKRERAVGDPGVGKFSGGTLKLSERDVRRIQGFRRTPASRRKAQKS